MPDNQSRFLELYKRFINDKATPEEVREFWDLAQIDEEDKEVKEIFQAIYEDPIPEKMVHKDWSKADDRIFGRKRKTTRISKRPWWAAAATIIFIVGIAGYFFSHKEIGMAPPGLMKGEIKKVVDVSPPAVSYATITLADGQRISLDSVKKGTLALQNNIALTKTGEDKIQYASGNQGKIKGLIFNTLTNPQGSRVINMVLNDGSNVWLNAASSITYPVAFEGKEREVSVTGEVYFEIAHDKNQKFIVKTGALSTEVLGTHFNVNSYPEEDQTKITLMEGSVKVLAKGSSTTIKPGEQAVEDGNGQIKINKKVNVEEVIAWKNERFNFNETNIKNIMKEVARWYDVEIEYKGSMEDLNFGGNMSRQKNVSELLKRMEATQAVKFKVEGRKITVTKVP